MNYKTLFFTLCASFVSCTTVKDIHPPYYIVGSMWHFIKEEHITCDTLHIEKLIIIFNDLDRNRDMGDKYRYNQYINKDSIKTIFIKAIQNSNYNIIIDENIEYLNEEEYLINNQWKFRIKFDKLKLTLEKSNKRLVLLPIIHLRDYLNLEFPPPVSSYKETAVSFIFLIFDNKINDFVYRSSFRHKLKIDTSHLTHEEEKKLELPSTQEDWNTLVELTMNRYIQTLNKKK